MSTPQPSSWLKRFWRERVLTLIVGQLKQGITPQKVAFTVAIGFNLGIFPIIGASTVLCLAAGFWFKLNQPLMLLINSVTIPLQPPMVLVFVRLGETMLHAPHVTFSIPELFRKFSASPAKFMHEFGLTGLHGIFAWALIAPLVVLIMYYALKPPLNRLATAVKPAPLHPLS